MVFAIFITFIILLRLGELILARTNERWLLQHGAIEYGKKHYPYIVILHILFIISLITEYILTGTGTYHLSLLVLYFVLLVFKAWVILSLGKSWNTKIYRVADFPLVNKGPYKYIKHPNYLIVITEILIIPLIFNLYFTAIVFSIFNGIILYIRIKEENKALAT